MKKSILLVFGMILLTACQNQTKTADFTYSVDKFYDLEILRYRVPGWEELTLQQKTLIYYLSEAALQGRDILFDQNGRYNLRIRRALEALYIAHQQDTQAGDADEWNLLEKYLKRVWFSNGIYHHYSEDKFLPEFSQTWFVEQMNHYGITYDEAILPVMFDAAVMSKRMNQAAGEDLVLTSAGNYYEGVTQAEAEAYYSTHKDDSAEPMWIGLNSKLLKENGVVKERIFKVGGMYGQALDRVVFYLNKALPYAETAEQREVIEKLIEFNETGDLKVFNTYCIAWVKDLNSRVDFINGFTETYTDPLGITGAWEAMVNFKDLEATKRTQIISDNAQWFEDHSTTDPQFKKEQVKGVTAKVITAAILGGDCYPATPIGINLPNANWIRKEYGSKSVTIDNLMHAYNEAAKGNGFNEEFMIDDATREAYATYGAQCGDLHTDLHECVGHGSGKLMPGVTKDALKEHASTIEEARADLFGLYYMADPKMVELGLLPNDKAYESYYYHQLMNGLMTQLVRIEPGKDIEEAHMRDRQLIAQWVYQHADKGEVEIVLQQGKHYLQINDYAGVRRLYGELLREIQRITSQGDYAAAKQMVETYAVKVDKTLHQEILNRYEKLNLAPYKGFVNPVYTAQADDQGNVTDVTIDYTEGYVEQHLRYSRDYSVLPDVN